MAAMQQNKKEIKINTKYPSVDDLRNRAKIIDKYN